MEIKTEKFQQSAKIPLLSVEILYKIENLKLTLMFKYPLALE